MSKHTERQINQKDPPKPHTNKQTNDKKVICFLAEVLDIHCHHLYQFL